jgi:tetratricopeptide (TPR) repeat protein
MNQHRKPITMDPPPPGTVVLDFDSAGAGAWFVDEATALFGLMGRSDPHTWRIAWSLADFDERMGRWKEWAVGHRAGIRAAQAIGDVEGQVRLRQSLGGHHLSLREFPDAVRELEEALALVVATGDRPGEAFTCWGLGAVSFESGDHSKALYWARRSLALYAELGDDGKHPILLSLIGIAAMGLGDMATGEEAIRQAAENYEGRDDYFGAAAAYEQIGTGLLNSGEWVRAAESFRTAIDIWRRLDNGYEVGKILMELGDALVQGGDLAGARAAWAESVQVLDDMRHPDVEAARQRLQRLTGSP